MKTATKAGMRLGRGTERCRCEWGLMAASRFWQRRAMARMMTCESAGSMLKALQLMACIA